tara:strand:- start:1995 stop:2237 length:243 start_codon:yes stop_codon:yes gene_type:complete
MTFATWIDTFVAEKNINDSQIFEVDGMSGLNMIPVAVLVEALKATSANEQAAIKKMIVKIDFLNGDVLDYFKHLAKAIAI